MSEYSAVYLSPHMDDAVLSCGGAIAARVVRGERVVVVTMCTCQPGYVSRYAEAHHRDSALSNEEAVPVRRREDQAAMHLLGAEYLWLGMQDAIYRLPESYNSDEALFGVLRDEEVMVNTLISALLKVFSGCREAILYAPLAVGSHVDHQLARFGARSLEKAGLCVGYYEDIPYVLNDGALERGLASVFDTPYAASTRAERIPIAETLEKKMAAIRCYASQVDDLAPIRRYAYTVSDNGTPAERVWWRVRSW
jgi:LmbE family N-acetylglucosaminyl deacetylase